MIYILLPSEIKKCEYIAQNWDINTRKLGIAWEKQYDRGTDGVPADVLNGVKSEYVVAKILGFEYSGDIGKPGGYDVGGKYEVRTTTYKNGHLILHPEDKKADYIFVVGDGNTFDVVGWINSEDGKKPEYWRTAGVRFPCYFVPQDKLKDIELLTT